MEMIQNEQFQSMVALFSAMLFLVWILPGVVNRSGKFWPDGNGPGFIGPGLYAQTDHGKFNLP